MSVVSMKALLEAGVHFGHRTRRWNPKMRPFIFTERSKIHIIDLQQTVQRLNEYHEMVRDLVARGGTIMFVGTKRQAQATIQAEAERCNMPYVNIRWLGGTLTNWVTIKQRIDYLLRLERRLDAGEFRNLPKKEQLSIQREVDKLNRRIGGLKTLTKIPDMIFVVDTNMEDLSVKEANKLDVPVLGIVDTNSDPDPIDFVIPSNDDAIRAVKLIVSVIADAVIEGLRIREIEMVETGQVSQQELAEMEQYLGPSTLAKLQTGEDDDYDDDDEYDDDYDDDDYDDDDEYDDDDDGDEEEGDGSEEEDNDDEEIVAAADSETETDEPAMEASATATVAESEETPENATSEEDASEDVEKDTRTSAE